MNIGISQGTAETHFAPGIPTSSAVALCMSGLTKIVIYPHCPYDYH